MYKTTITMDTKSKCCCCAWQTFQQRERERESWKIFRRKMALSHLFYMMCVNKMLFFFSFLFVSFLSILSITCLVDVAFHGPFVYSRYVYYRVFVIWSFRRYDCVRRKSKWTIQFIVVQTVDILSTIIYIHKIHISNFFTFKIYCKHVMAFMCVCVRLHFDFHIFINWYLIFNFKILQWST